MGKLITEFTPITAPAGSRLMTLGDEITGERFELNITEFFAQVDAPASFNGQITSNHITASGLNLQNDGSRFINFKDSGGTAQGRIFYDASNTMSFRTAGVDALTFDGSQKATFAGDVNVLGNVMTFGSSAHAPIGGSIPTFQLNGLDANNTGGIKLRSSDGSIEANMYAVAGGMIFGTTTNHNVSINANNVTRLFVASGGGVTMSSLAGIGTRTVVVDANGVLSAP